MSSTDDPSSSIQVSEWQGEGVLVRPATAADRPGSVWIPTEDWVVLRDGVDRSLESPQYQQLLQCLQQKEFLTVLHEQDSFITELNEIHHDQWCRIRRYASKILDPKETTSVVYEESLAQLVEKPVSTQLADNSQEAINSETTILPTPLLATWAVQQSIGAARAGAWVRVVGTWRYADTTYGLVQEYDGAGFIVALAGAEFQYPFVLEVLMAFSDALFRGTHDMWIKARYPLFRHRYATWQIDQIKDDFGPAAPPLYQNMRHALTRMDCPEIVGPLVEQLQRISRGFASGDGQVLVQQAREALRGEGESMFAADP